MTNAPKKKLYFDRNLQILFAITLIAIQGVSSITPAFPKIVRVFDITPQQAGLLITFFTLPGVILTPVLGVLADRLGRKRILVPSLFLYAIAGVACAFIRDYDLLLVFRLLQGMGAASLGSLNVTLIGDLYSGRERAAAMGYNASVLSVGTATYPLIGGALAAAAWYAPLLLPVLAVPVGLLVLFVLDNPEPDANLTFREYATKAWASIRDRHVIGIFTLSLLSFIILYGSYLTYFPFLVDQKFGHGSVVIGGLMASMSLTTATVSSQLGRLAKRFSAATLLMFAYSFYGVAMLTTPFMTNPWLLLIPTVLFGIGHGVNIPTFLTLLSEYSTPDQRGALMSINGMILRLGQTLGPLVISGVFTLWGLDPTFFAGAAVAGLMLLVVLMLVK